MKKLLTIAIVSATVLTAGFPTVAQAQHRGGFQGGHREWSQRGHHDWGHWDHHGWSAAGQILTGVVLGGLLFDACAAPPPPRVVYVPPVVYAPPVYQASVVQYAPPPVVVVPPAPSVETVWVQNSNGSKTPVQLRRADGGMYVGPRGEYYPGLPTNEQLRQLYGM